MDTSHFIFDTNTIIQYTYAGDIRVRVSYAMSLHKIEPPYCNETKKLPKSKLKRVKIDKNKIKGIFVNTEKTSGLAPDRDILCFRKSQHDAYELVEIAKMKACSLKLKWVLIYPLICTGESGR
uniref:Uncharacterized protein n=1 Tax=Cucumis melo TaxID=3656 RepID=A0A9I9EBG5_CUCME